MERSEWTFWLDDNMLTHPDGRVIRFTCLESDILSGILRAHGHLARREYLYSYVFGLERDDGPAVRELDVMVCRVRKILRKHNVDFTIETVMRAGLHTTKVVSVRKFKIGEDCCPTCGRMNEEKVA